MCPLEHDGILATLYVEEVCKRQASNASDQMGPGSSYITPTRCEFGTVASGGAVVLKCGSIATSILRVSLPKTMEKINDWETDDASVQQSAVEMLEKPSRHILEILSQNSTPSGTHRK